VIFFKKKTMDSFERRRMCRVNVDPEDEIVISGISGRFPRSHNVAELSYNLYNKIDMLDGTNSRFKHLNDDVPKRVGLTNDLDRFDANFFSINRRSAQFMDPQQRILQEHAYEAIIDAGICPKELRGSKTGVFVGCCSAEIDDYLLFSEFPKDGMGMLGTARAMLANRISFSMDFKGPSLEVDTACSSSGYALDMAFSAIRSGECDAAIVGGSNLIVNESASLQFTRLIF
jgi:fatty acid synthase